MNTHLETIGLLNDRRSKNEQEIEELTRKIEKLDHGIEQMRKAKRVLNARRKRLSVANVSFGKKITYELNECRKLEEANEQKQTKFH